MRSMSSQLHEIVTSRPSPVIETILIPIFKTEQKNIQTSNTKDLIYY